MPSTSSTYLVLDQVQVSLACSVYTYIYTCRVVQIKATGDQCDPRIFVPQQQRQVDRRFAGVSFADRREEDMMLDPVPDVLIHGCLIVSVSSFLIMLALQPLLPAANVSRGVCSASRAALVRLLSGRRSDDGGVSDEAPPPPPPRRRSRSRSNNSPRHCCERCAASSWPDVVAAVTASLRLDDDGGGGGDESEDEEGGCGGCAATAAVEDLLERKEATEQELREAFYVFDRDEDGFVGATELWNVLRRLGMLPPGPDCCARMIAAHDADGDGRISFRDFRAMMEHAA